MNTTVDPNFIIRGSKKHGHVSMVIHTEDTVKSMILFGGRLDRYISLSRLSVTRQIKVYGFYSLIFLGQYICKLMSIAFVYQFECHLYERNHTGQGDLTTWSNYLIGQ